MKSEYLIDRQGKQYVLFAGLLDFAHSLGLKSIDTDLVQVPIEENGRVAVVKARIEMEDGRTFSGIGDASPENVGRNIAPHIIRMAETRSKARALRDACNIGATALEELGGEEEPANPPAKPRRSAPQRKGELSVVEGNASGDKSPDITDEELNNLVETAKPHFTKKQLDTAHARWQEYTHEDYEEALKALHEMIAQKEKANQSG